MDWITLTFSKPVKNVAEILGKDYIRIKFSRNENSFYAEYFTEKQTSQKKHTYEEVDFFYQVHAGKTFRNVNGKTSDQEITVMTNRHGESKTISKKIQNRLTVPSSAKKEPFGAGQNRQKNYIIKEGSPVPFLIHLGVMTRDGKVVAQKYDKFRQINRFLEFVRDILEDLENAATDGKGFCEERPLRIADFGCGKSYLTFAVHYYLCEMKKIPVEIVGLDLKEDVINHCNRVASELGCNGLHFYTGDVSKAQKHSSSSPDLMITLHACDTELTMH